MPSSGRKMVPTNSDHDSDDEDYNMNEREAGMNINENPTLNSTTAAVGNSYSYGDAEEKDDGISKEPVLCQPVGEGSVGGNKSCSEGDNNNNAGLPRFQEVDMEEDDDDDDLGDLHRPPRSRDDDCSEDDDGSDSSSAEKYADRNSDPGVDVNAGAEYFALPIHPHHDPLSRRGSRPEDSLPANMAMTNAMDPNRGLRLDRDLASGLPPNPMPGLHGPGGGESINNETATQTHEVRMPMLLSTFKPATGCTNASDFIVRCFVARLRSGITVVKHGRSRWCKSRLRVLHVHPDGRSLSWKPALGEPSSGKRPPKLDLTSCKEVRHAWSPDPDNPMFTGTPILRQKCEAANAHKSFALIFPKRTVDITAVTADQCKVLMEGFSALCFRLQVAQNVASAGGGAKAGSAGKGGTEDGATTESVTLTNNSSTLREGSPKKKGGRKRSFR